MDRHEVVAAAREKGLLDPRVMPFRRRTGEMALKLYFGPLSDRRERVIEPDVTPEALEAVLTELATP